MNPILYFLKKKKSMTITPHIISIGSQSIPLRNIAEMQVKKNIPFFESWSFKNVCTCTMYELITIGVALNIASHGDIAVASSLILASGAILYFVVTPYYELRLQTNAGPISIYVNYSKEFIKEIREKIEYAIAHPESSVVYQVINNNIKESIVGSMVGGNKKS